MTEQQKRFCEYLIEQEGQQQTKAAIRAGYSEKSAASQASQMLKNPKVLAYYHSLKVSVIQELKDAFVFDALRARAVMREVLENEESSDKDRIAVARDFLDRAGFKPMDKVEHSGEVNNPFAGLTTAELRRLAGVADDD